jgi:O-antigen ligase
MREPKPVGVSGSTAAQPERALDRLSARAKEIGPALASTGVPFVLTLYLALRGGGYDAITRSELGVAIWWIVLLGALVGLLPLVRISRAGWAMLVLLVAFGAWTSLGLLWTESSERTVIEIARVGTYIGVFALTLCVQGPGSLRRTVTAVGAACAAVGVLALLSRLYPAWFPENETANALDYARARLNYPVNYWNGLAYLIAIGIPLLLTIATRSRRIVVQSLTTAVIPMLVLACFYTISRGGALALLIALVAFVALHPRRLSMVPTLGVVAASSVLLIAAATQRNALADGLSNAAATSQGDRMIAVVLVVCVGAGLVQAAIGLATRYEVGSRLRPSRQATRVAFGAAAIVALVSAIAFGAPSKLSDRWEEFKSPDSPPPSDTTDRYESASGNGRYQWWQGAVDANSTDPLVGTGPGTFEFYWARAGSQPGFVRDAHSLYLETFAELGIVGAALILALVVGPLRFAVRRALRSPEAERPWIAAAVAGCVAFAVAATFDWVWELAVLPVAFLCLVAALLSGGAEVSSSSAEPRPRARSRFALGGLAAVSLVAIGVPMAGSVALRSSQDNANARNLADAEGSAREAGRIEPWAASPPLQTALVLELRGDYGAASTAARDATDAEPTNWRNWLVLSRIEAYRGDAVASVNAYDRAASLNPRSPLFTQQ